MKLFSQSYGKQKVRFLRVLRGDSRHEIFEVSAGIALDGDFEAAYLGDDNSAVVATDTMKNTLLALAYRFEGRTIEEYGIVVAAHFLKKYAHVQRVSLTLEQKPWCRVSIASGPHPHAFEGGTAISTARLVATREQVTVFGGVKNWQLLKTTGSGFAGFPRDEFTTLPETSDRILATEATIEWEFLSSEADFETTRLDVQNELLRVFAENFSPSVQRTLFQMGEAALLVAPELAKIKLTMPNKHYLPLNLTAFGAPEGQSTILLPTDEPHGKIEATVAR